MPVYEYQNNGTAIFADYIWGGVWKIYVLVFIMIVASYKGYIHEEKIIVFSAVVAFSVDLQMVL